MSSSVWKYPIEAIPLTELMMPKGARVLYVGCQGTTPVLWAEVDPAAESSLRQFMVVTTGEAFYAGEVPGGDKMEYVGTFQLPLPGGEYVGHVYENVQLR